MKAQEEHQAQFYTIWDTPPRAIAGHPRTMFEEGKQKGLNESEPPGHQSEGSQAFEASTKTETREMFFTIWDTPKRKLPV